MKKIYKLIIIILFMLPIYINAACNDEELLEWATNAQVSFTLSSDLKAEDLGFSYFLSIKPMRNDIVIKVTDGNGDTVKGERFFKEETVFEEDDSHNETVYDFYAVGCYTNLEEETYVMEVYGGENSKCKNELLKTLHYTVPRYNRMEKDGICEKHPDHELCQTFTNITKDMTEDDFNKKMKEYENNEDDSVFNKDNLLGLLMSYSLYAIIPFVIITIIYFVRRRGIKKKGEDF